LIGVTSKGAKIYSAGDPADKSSRVIFLRIRDVSKIDFMGFGIDVKDLNLQENEHIVNDIMDEKPGWLITISSSIEEQRTFLRSQAQINMSGVASLHIANNIEVVFVDNI
jgi:hypothetical protein